MKNGSHNQPIEALESRVLLSTAYTVTNLGGIVGDSINDANQVAGYVSVPDPLGTFDLIQRPALWSNGKLIEFAPPGAQGQAQQINAAGDVVGYTYDTKYHGFLYHNGVFRALGDLPGVTANDLSIGTLANGINDHGVIVGQADDASGSHAVVFGKNGIPHIIPGGAN